MNDILVCIFQRGGADGLNSLIPYTSGDYYDIRPSIAVPPPGETGGVIELDGTFGLYPEGAELKSLFDMRQLAAVDATGVPHGIRSPILVLLTNSSFK